MVPDVTRILALTRTQRYGIAILGVSLAGLLRAGLEDRVAALLELLGFDLWHPVLEARASDGNQPLLQGLSEFREHLGGELTITLLEEIGRGIEVHEMDEARVREAIGWLKARRTAP